MINAVIYVIDTIQILRTKHLKISTINDKVDCIMFTDKGIKGGNWKKAKNTRRELCIV